MPLNLPLDECIDNTHILVTKEKKKRKETTKRNSNKRLKDKGKAKSKITRGRQSLGPLRQGQRLDTTETKTSSNKEHKPLSQSSKATKSSPCINARSPWTNATLPRRMHAYHFAKQSRCFSLALTGQSGQPHRSDRCARSSSTWAS
jgi:hypothetical protein